MKLSFVIPAYNEEALLGPCLHSIMAQLAQERVDAEIIVVNNASTDRTRAVAAAFPGVRLIDEPRRGLVRARQAGFVAATGELIANLDADTRLTPGWLAQVSTRFRRDPALTPVGNEDDRVMAANVRPSPLQLTHPAHPPTLVLETCWRAPHDDAPSPRTHGRPQGSLRTL
jgi:glycosyltransferase involved in cell wall biosynthesis